MPIIVLYIYIQNTSILHLLNIHQNINTYNKAYNPNLVLEKDIQQLTFLDAYVVHSTFQKHEKIVRS